jgi:hypothetical protein
MKKNLLFSLGLLVICGFVSGQNHTLPEPKGWETETFPIPIDFAPGIPYKGSEELRFAPGWGDTKSEQRWSYCFLWWIEADSKLDASSLKKYLEEYYGGLVGRNITSRKIPASKVVPTNATVTETKNADKPFTATVDMLDYMSQNPVTLNIDVNQKICTANGKKGFFFSISPQPRTHAIWQEFQAVWNGFKCGE